MNAGSSRRPSREVAGGERRPPEFGTTSNRPERLQGFEACQEEWRALAEKSGNLFATWEWASTWWRHLGGDRRLRLLGCRAQDGALVAIVPLYDAASRPLRITRFAGHGPADQLGPVAAPAHRTAAANALRAELGTAGQGPDLILAERLPGGEGWLELLPGAKVIRRESSPVVRIDGASWEDFLGSRSANFRSQVRRRERKLVREHGLRFRRSDDPSRLASDFDTFLALHRTRWGEQSGAFGPVRRAFHLDFAAQALAHGWLRLWFAEVGGQAVAAWYGFRFGESDWYYQAGRDPAWEHSSVGFVLLAHTIRDAFEHGMREYRLLLGAETYKDRFATDDPGLETLALAGTARGRAALHAESIAERLPGRASRVAGRLIDRGTRR